jgi:hypothetical protein
MAWSFNPFTGNLDLSGSSGGESYIDGDVEYHSNLPVTVGTPAVNSAFLVRKGEGLYFISRKPAGIWVRELNNGNLDDWKFAGLFSDLYRDANFRIISDSDVSKELAFSLSGITTGTTRTITVPDANITLDDSGDTRDPNAHSHTLYGEIQGAITDDPSTAFSDLVSGLSADALDQTGSVAGLLGGGQGILFSVSDFAASGSITNSGLTQSTARILGRTTASTGSIEEIQIGSGLSLSAGELSANFAAPPAIGSTTRNSGAFTTLTANNGTLTASAPVLDLAQTWNNAAVAFTGLRFNVTNTASASTSDLVDIQIGGTTQLRLRGNQLFVGQFTNSGIYSPAPAYIGSTAGLLCATQLSIGNNLDTILIRDGASGALAQRNGAVAQTFNIYNTFTSSTNHERGFLRWSSNVFQIGTEKGSGGGTARQMDFQIDGTNFLSVRSNGVRTTGLTNHVGNTDSVAQIGFGQFSFNAGGANNSGGILFYDGNGGGVSTRLGLDANNVLAIKSGTAAQAFRIYNTTTWERLNIRWASNECIIDTEAGGTGTLRGIKIGSATSSLLGFYGVTPVDQPATVADPAGGGTVDAEARTAVNAIIDRLQELGLIA